MPNYSCVKNEKIEKSPFKNLMAYMKNPQLVEFTLERHKEIKFSHFGGRPSLLYCYIL